MCPRWLLCHIRAHVSSFQPQKKLLSHRRCCVEFNEKMMWQLDPELNLLLKEILSARHKSAHKNTSPPHLSRTSIKKGTFRPHTPDYSTHLTYKLFYLSSPFCSFRFLSFLCSPRVPFDLRTNQIQFMAHRYTNTRTLPNQILINPSCPYLHGNLTM